jgi:hypothetical protein
VDADLDTLATALYVTIDDLLQQAPHLAPWRPRVGIPPKLSDAELLTLAVMQALLGFTSEPAGCDLQAGTCATCSPTCPARAATTSACAARPSSWATSSEPSRPTPRCGATMCGWWTPPRWSAAARARPSSVRRWPGGPSTATAPATRATSGGCGCIWCAPSHGLPVAVALTGAKADERQVLLDLLAVEPELVAARPGQVLIADKNYYGHQFQRMLGELGLGLLRPARKGEPQPAGAQLFKPLRQLIESVNATFKGQLDWNATAAAPASGSRSGSCSASSPSPPRSGTTTRPDSRPCGRWSPMTTDPLESIV